MTLVSPRIVNSFCNFCKSLRTSRLTQASNAVVCNVDCLCFFLTTWCVVISACWTVVSKQKEGGFFFSFWGSTC